MALNILSFQDRIEAGTFLVAAALAGTEVTLRRVNAEHLNAVTNAISDAGFRLKSSAGLRRRVWQRFAATRAPDHRTVSGFSRRTCRPKCARF
jgi:UDP-N-acetylglucosamine enolpyruvyl transferase